LTGAEVTSTAIQNSKCAAIATILAAKAPLATRYIIDAVNHGLEMSLADGQFLEATLFGLVASSDDMKEGTRAFLEKRQPSWAGR